MRVKAFLGFGLVSVLGAVVSSQGCGGGSSLPDTGFDAGGNGTGGRQGGNGSGGDLFATSSAGGSGSGGDDSCAAVTQEATLTSRPVDIIFVIDNSGSMGGEIEDVEEQINQNFASIIDGAMPPIDYRVIMVSEFGNFASGQSICISAPLGGIPDADMDGHCDNVNAQPQPIETSNFFHHSVPISSRDALCKFLDYYALGDQYNLHPTGFGPLLRQEAFKFIVVVTDDEADCDSYDDMDTPAGGQAVATEFDADVLALDPAQFGTAMDRDYQFWSIVSQAPYMVSGMKPDGLPVPPTEPSTSQVCTPSAVSPGTGYQELSILTGGYRFPTCGLDYTDIFALMAQGVIDGAQVACEFEIPEPPPGEELDLDTVEVVYSSNDVEVDTYTKVTDATACTPTSFYIDAGAIVLCPDACVVVQADESAKIDLRFDCKQIIE